MKNTEIEPTSNQISSNLEFSEVKTVTFTDSSQEVQNLDIVLSIDSNVDTQHIFQPKNFDLADFPNGSVLRNGTFKMKILSADIMSHKEFSYSVTNCGKFSRKFQSKWLDLYPWLAYSKREDGVFCKICILFLIDFEIGKGSYQCC